MSQAGDHLKATEARLNQLRQKAHGLDGQRTVLVEQKASAILEIETAQSYLKHKDEVLEFLNALQTSAQQKTKTMYEELLTSLIREVLPHKKDRIVFDTSIKNNKMALDVNIVNEGGKKLNVVKDKGGTIQNIVSMGLRFITVARSRNRKIILLDEADQWLKTKYIPRFAKIVRRLSEELGVQVIYISHHSPDAFGQHAKVVTLLEKEGKVYCQDDAHPNIGEDDYGIRHIRLKMFKSHTDTIIALDKYVTVITGEGDVGKSSVIEAFHILMNNEGRDAIVKNGKKSTIELGIEEDRTISFEYDLSREKKSLYTLIESDGSKPETSNDGRNKPTWLNDYLATPLVADFDIHISFQSNSNFILDTTYSAQRRAEILSLDNEAEHIQKIIKLHGEKCSMYQKSLTTLNKSLNGIKSKLEKLNYLNKLFESIETATESLMDVKQLSQEVERIAGYGMKLKGLTTKLSAFSGTESLRGIEQIQQQDFDLEQKLKRFIDLNDHVEQLNVADSAPDIEPIEMNKLSHISKAGSRIKKLQMKLDIVSQCDQAPVIDTEIEFSKLSYQTIANYSRLKARADLFSKMDEAPAIIDAVIVDNSKGSHLLKQMETRQGLLASSISDLESVTAEEQAILAELKILEDSMGHCPLCQGSFCHDHTKQDAA